MKKKISVLLLVVLMLFTTFHTPVFASTEERNDLNGCTIILFSSDIHGEVDGYRYMAGLKNYFSQLKAKIITIDAGDYSQGSPYVNMSKGASAISLMNDVGYDVATLGNHDFDYGINQLKQNLENAEFDVLCSNIFDSDNKPLFKGNKILTVDGVKIGFFGIVTPQTLTNGNPNLADCLNFASGEELYKVAQTQIDELKINGADIIICISHLGISDESHPNNVYDLYYNTTGIDAIIDGHGDTAMLLGQNGENICKLQKSCNCIGALLIDNNSKKIENKEIIDLKYKDSFITDFSYLIDPTRYGSEKVNNNVSSLQKQIDDLYNAEFAETSINLDCNKNDNLTVETNLGNLITDSIRWYFVRQYTPIDNDNVVAVINGDSILNNISTGSITRKDIHNIISDNTMSVIYMTGRELLEALEATAYNMPDASNAFPQVSGMQIEIDTTRKYDANDTVYPDSTYYGPKTINRVLIKNINGHPFDENKIYTIVTNDLLAKGGDTYYAFNNASACHDTGIPIDEAVMEYITVALEGKISESSYGKIGERIKVVTNHNISDKKVEKVYDCEDGGHIAYYPCLDEGCDAKFSDANGTIKYKDSEIIISGSQKHEFIIVGEIKATSAKDGYTGDKKCVKCGKIIEKGKVISALGDNNSNSTIKRVKIKKIKRLSNNKHAKITLMKVKGAKGYQIKYSTSKKFKKKLTKTINSKKRIRTIKKLKNNKKYYFKARAYKIVNGKKKYGKWSIVKVLSK